MFSNVTAERSEQRMELMVCAERVERLARALRLEARTLWSAAKAANEAESEKSGNP